MTRWNRYGAGSSAPVLACCLLFVCTTTATADSLGKLRLVKVEVVSQNEIPARDKFWSEGVITEPLFRVTFSTDVDLQRLAKEHGYNIDNRTAICRGSLLDSERSLNGLPSVLDGSGRIDEFRHGDDGPSNRPPFEYHIYFGIAERKVPNFYHYDLERDAHDICISVNPAQETMFIVADRLQSEPLIVPAKDIVAAVNKAGAE